MKTLDEWCDEHFRFADLKSREDLSTLVRNVRREAFERCELEAYRADSETSTNTGLSVPTGWGKHVAERIAKVRREEGDK